LSRTNATLKQQGVYVGGAAALHSYDVLWFAAPSCISSQRATSNDTMFEVVDYAQPWVCTLDPQVDGVLPTSPGRAARFER
jgi:hypothetical protein